MSGTDQDDQDWDAYLSRFTTGASDEFRWLSAVLVVPCPGPGGWGPLRQALAEAVESVVRPQLRPEGQVEFSLLWTTLEDRISSVDGLDWSMLPADATRVAVSAQVAPSTGVPSADGGYVVFAETDGFTLGDHGQLLAGFGVVQGALSGGSASPAVQSAAVQWLRRWLGPLAASAGWVTVDFTNRPDSVYESVHQPRTRVFDPSSTLIGYGPWTLLGPGHAARLDRAALAGLAELEELPGGQLLASLGPDANEVPVERLRALGRQLAPVLAAPTRTAAEYLALDPRENVIIPYRI